MDRLIEIKIGGNHLWKDTNLAGVQGEGNVTDLRITFDEGWSGYAKSITFFNAKGKNPVKRTLTADLLEDITKSTLVYLCKIPPEPLTEAGRCSFVIEGYVDEKRQRVVETEMEVQPARDTDDAAVPGAPTPSQAEQIQAQIENILGDMQEQAIIATDAANNAKASEDNAKTSEDNAKLSEANAKTSAEAAEEARQAAEDSKDLSADNALRAEQALNQMGTKVEEAAQSAAEAKAAQAKAEEAEAAAEQSAQNAAASAANASGAAASVQGVVDAAAASAAQAKTSAQNAAASASAAKSSETYAAASASNAKASENNVVSKVAAAESAKKDAESAAARAETAQSAAASSASSAASSANIASLKTDETKSNAEIAQSHAINAFGYMQTALESRTAAVDAQEAAEAAQEAAEVARAAAERAAEEAEYAAGGDYTNIFYCYYDETTYEEVEEEYQSGNIIVLSRDYELWPLVYAEEYTKYVFRLVTDEKVKTATLDIFEGWSETEEDSGGGGGVPVDHASREATYGKGTISHYGHVMLSDAMDSYDGSTSGVAATPLAVKIAYDKAKEALAAAGSGGSQVATATLPKGRMKGDVNGDGEVSKDDTALITDHANGSITLDEVQVWCGDVNNDGVADAKDITQLNRHLAGVGSVLTSIPRMADYYGNWTYVKVDNLSGYFYTDIAVKGITAASSAIVAVQGNHKRDAFVGAECFDGYIRIKANLLPVADATCLVFYSPGDGTAVVVPENVVDRVGAPLKLMLGVNSTNSSTVFTITINDMGVITATGNTGKAYTFTGTAVT